jgi:hypothetical protein
MFSAREQIGFPNWKEWLKTQDLNRASVFANSNVVHLFDKYHPHNIFKFSDTICSHCGMVGHLKSTCTGYMLETMGVVRPWNRNTRNGFCELFSKKF